KVAVKRTHGLTSTQKLAGQLVIAIILYITLYLNDFPTYIGILGTSIQWELGHFYGLLVIFMLVGVSNAFNLTDGLDGLLAMKEVVPFGAFALLASYHFP